MLPALFLAAAALAAASPITVVINGWAVTGDAADGSFRVVPPGASTAAMRGPGTCAAQTPAVRIATGAPYTEWSFGATRIEMTSSRSSLVWRGTCTGTATVTTGPARLALTWPLDGPGPAATATLTFSPQGAHDLRVALSTTLPSATAGEIAAVAAPGEGYFGLGTQVVGMDLRGHTFPLWTQEQGIGKPVGGGYFPLNNIPRQPTRRWGSGTRARATPPS